MSAIVLAFIVFGLAACATSKDQVQTATPAVTQNLPPAEHANPPYEGVRAMMRAKLAHAQAVLEGVATNRMDQVESNANALVRLSELTEWQVHRTMEYGLYSDDFRTNASELARHAKAGKLHAATLDYMQLTMTCVRCHDYMSQSGLVKIDLQSLLATQR